MSLPADIVREIRNAVAQEKDANKTERARRAPNARPQWDNTQMKVVDVPGNPDIITAWEMRADGDTYTQLKAKAAIGTILANYVNDPDLNALLADVEKRWTHF